jgi:hypothetical protein
MEYKIVTKTFKHPQLRVNERIGKTTDEFNTSDLFDENQYEIIQQSSITHMGPVDIAVVVTFLLRKKS